MPHICLSHNEQAMFNAKHLSKYTTSVSHNALSQSFVVISNVQCPHNVPYMSRRSASRKQVSEDRMAKNFHDTNMSSCKSFHHVGLTSVTVHVVCRQNNRLPSNHNLRNHNPAGIQVTTEGSTPWTFHHHQPQHAGAQLHHHRRRYRKKAGSRSNWQLLRIRFEEDAYPSWLKSTDKMASRWPSRNMTQRPERRSHTRP